MWRHACLRWVSVSCAICKFHGNIFLQLVRRKTANARESEGESESAGDGQLSLPGHHQSFCLKEYIAIKSRKYAFTLASRAISLPLIHSHILWSTPPPRILFMKRRTLGHTHCILTAEKLWRELLASIFILLPLLLMFYYPAKSSKLKLLHSGPPSTL